MPAVSPEDMRHRGDVARVVEKCLTLLSGNKKSHFVIVWVEGDLVQDADVHYASNIHRQDSKDLLLSTVMQMISQEN